MPDRYAGAVLPDPAPTAPPTTPAFRHPGRLLVLPLAAPEVAALRDLLAHADQGRTRAERAGADRRGLARSALLAERLEAALMTAPALVRDLGADVGEVDAIDLPAAGAIIAGLGCATARIARDRALRDGVCSQGAWVHAAMALGGLLARAVVQGDDRATQVALGQLVLLCDAEHIQA